MPLVYTSYFVMTKETKGEFSSSLIMQKIFYDIDECIKKFNASQIIIAAEGGVSWRKSIYPDYKSGRALIEHAEELKQITQKLINFFNDYTNIHVVSVDSAEADDIIAIITQEFDDNFVIISSDTDFVQLIRPNVRLYAPTLDKERTSDDPKYDLFLKCIRGDRTDNIMSAYPRVYETKLKDAWNNPLDMINIMEHKLKDGSLVKEKFEFNKKLIDLTQQPSELRNEILETINNIKSKNNYNFMKILRFMGDHELVKMAKNIEKFSKIFRLTYTA